MNDQDQVDYRQQLGLKKILYKYQNQNQQLKSQIKALNQRLNSIINKPKTPQKLTTLDPIQQYQGKLLKQQMLKLYQEVNKQTQQMKINKNSIDFKNQQKCKQIQNKILQEERQIKQFKSKLDKYQKIDEGIKLGNFISQNIENKSGNPRKQKDNINQNIQNGNLSMNSNSMSKQINSNYNYNLAPILQQPILLKNLTLRSSTIRIQNYFQKLNLIIQQTQKIKKSIKELQKQRDQNNRKLIKKHTQQVDVKQQNRQIEYGKVQQSIDESPRKKKGVWGLQNTKENYQMIKKQIQILKNQKQSTLNTIKNQNIVLKNKIKELQSQLDGINKSIQMPPLPYNKKSVKISMELSNPLKIQSSLMKKSMRLELGVTQFQRNNDKNFVPKKLRSVTWQSTKNKSGIQWYDGNLKSPIIGVNLWFEGHLMGLEFIHQLGNSSQHLQLMNGKKYIPIQYRLSTNDYVENIIIYHNDGIIVSIEFTSKNGRNDSFGNKNKAKKFDFGIRKPQKPVISFGQFKINNNISEITKLGFQII